MAKSEPKRILYASHWWLEDLMRAVAHQAAERGWFIDFQMAVRRQIPWHWRGDGILTTLSGDPGEGKNLGGPTKEDGEQWFGGFVWCENGKHIKAAKHYAVKKTEILGPGKARIFFAGKAIPKPITSEASLVHAAQLAKAARGHTRVALEHNAKLFLPNEPARRSNLGYGGI